MMGFDLNCVFTLDANVFSLFDTVIPGGSGHALRTCGPGLPDGWVLPDPWELEYGVDGQLTASPSALEPADLGAWRAAAAIPSEADPLDAFDETDFRLGSFLSLAAPVLLISDSTFGGVLGHEHAALLVNGRLIAACGVNYIAKAAFRLDDGIYNTVPPEEIAPVTQCAAALDIRFSGRCLFDGYLPREAHREGDPCRKTWSTAAPRIADGWHRHFPFLTP
ncbi:hypothetical protein ACTWQF_08815 [Streptomyces sp. 8N114]|uniref:hypothetical protein n=1 Tax=Streptomyces sp. 8N114 TaxID=3457419 RepID=UPI003FD45176